jgi:hypothetical protein
MWIQSWVRWMLMLGTVALPLGASAGPLTSYNLGIRGELWGNSLFSNFQFDDDFDMSGINMNLSGPLVNAQAGDISANWDQLGLAGRSFQGLSSGFSLGKADMSLIGGTVVIQPDIIDPGVDILEPQRRQPITSPLYGLRTTLPLGRTLGLSMAQLFTPDAPDTQGKLISTLALNYQSGMRQRLGLEVAHSHAGIGWQMSASRESKRLNLRASYRHVGNGFSTAGNPTLRTRRNGGYANVRYNLARRLTLTANAQRYDDGIGGHSNAEAVTLRFAPRNKMMWSLFWRSSDNLRMNHNGEDRAAITQSAGMRLSHKLGVNRLSVQYENLQLRYPIGEQSDAVSNRFSLGLSRPLGRQTQLSLSHIMNFGRESVARSSTTASVSSHYTSADFRHQLGKSGLRLNLGFQYQGRQALSNSGNAAFLRCGFDYKLASGSSIGMQYVKGISGSGTWNRSDRMHIGYTHHFSGNGRVTQRVLTQQQRRELGRVRGKVFEDLNSNGLWDTGEPGIADVAVGAQGSQRLQTDQSGFFYFTDLNPGERKLQLVTKTLPIEYSLLNTTLLPVQVEAGKTIDVGFPVVRTGQATGVVFMDTNRNGVRDEGELGVANAVVRAQGSDIISFTNAQGHFTLQGLAPKTWTLVIDTNSIGEGYLATGAGSVEVRVTPNATIDGISLGLAPVQREIIKSFVKDG